MDYQKNRLRENKCPHCNKALDLHSTGMICKKCGSLYTFEEIKKESENPSAFSYDKTPTRVICDYCGKPFEGQAWMMQSKKRVNCPDCWKDLKKAF